MLTEIIDNIIFEPEIGYDLVANNYDKTHWSGFWQANEYVYVKKWLFSLNKGVGLDAGSGTGKYLPLILEAKNTCIAIDISRQMLRISSKKYGLKYKNIKFIKANICNLPFPINHLNWVLCTRVFSHIANINTVLTQFHNALKNGGQVFISDIHPEHSYTTTAFHTGKEKVKIRTFKHSIKTILNSATNAGFKIKGFQEFDLKNIELHPDIVLFNKLYSNPEKKIFYILILEK